MGVLMRGAIAASLLACVGVSPALAATSTYPGCGRTLARCIAKAPARSTIVLRTNQAVRIPQSLSVTKGLALVAARGFRPIVGPRSGIAELRFTPAGTRGNVVMHGIRFTFTSISIEFVRGVHHRAVFDHNTIRQNSPSNGEGGISIGYGPGSRGTVSVRHDDISSSGVGIEVSVRGGPAVIAHNSITSPVPANSQNGIGIFGSGSGVVRATVADNLIHDVADCGCGTPAGLQARALDTVTLQLRLVGNTVDRAGGAHQAYGVIIIDSQDPGSLLDVLLDDNVVSFASNYDLFLEDTPRVRVRGAANDSYGAPQADVLGSFDVGALHLDPRYEAASLGNYHPGPGSPLVNAGTTCIGTPPLPRGDLAGRFRVAGRAVDIGAFEYRSRTPGAVPGVNRSGDSGRNGVIGSAGRDVLCGLGGRDTLSGRAGPDWIDGGGGIDRVHAGAGNDTVHSDDGLAETVFCGPGRDRAFADASDTLHGCESVTRVP